MTMADETLSQDWRGSTTEPNTPESVPDLKTPSDWVFARLIPTNRPAQAAIEKTFALNSSHHSQFIAETEFRDKRALCFELSLRVLPEYPQIGWRIGKGRADLGNNRGVDLLLHGAGGDDVAGQHARLNWVKGAAGFFLIASNRRGKRCTMNGDDFTHDRRVIPFKNTIMLGECAFTLQYVVREPKEEDRFQVELKEFCSSVLQDKNPYILPTPREADARFGDWVVQHAISKGAYGTVYMVTHAADGRPAAAKQLLKTRWNARQVEHEVKMALRISKLEHPGIASPFYIRQRPCRSAIEISRIKDLLSDTWDPKRMGDITDEYIIFSPLLNATFHSIITSTLPESRRTHFFARLLEGVAFLHDQGLCHRDIKPGNILIRSYDPPEALLSDFGCASDQNSILYDRPGTVPYLAPEQREGLKHGRAVDYWACAIVGYELLTGEVTHGRIEPGPVLDYYHKTLDDRGSVMAECCKDMLNPDPDARISAREAANALALFFAVQEKSQDGQRSGDESDAMSLLTYKRTRYN
ncbi:kinase-like protein [Westerdykella ornata]|uniref:Kinase-like protein n=1 Tax=Westerdykella ornata TaxID=318751 RepID=A0A6A6JHB7_WESOR|nr:kinase-like protein [Westerdykella ornata]KAF2275503.1 kinase-like protein [Westerdykella ornata]